MLLLVPKGRQCANRATITRTEIAPWQQVLLGGLGARAGDSPVSPEQGAGGDEGRAAELLGGRFAQERVAKPRAADFHTSHARRRSPSHLPPKPGESPRRSYAIVGKSSNCRDNATGVTHASTESCGVRLEITHMHIYRACL